MASSSSDAAFTVWGADLPPYGPVELPTLVSSVESERVTADTWVFAATDRIWHRAAELPELKLFFQNKSGTGSGAEARTNQMALDCHNLRHLKILSGLTDEQLERFAAFMEVQSFPQWATIVKQGDRGDAMYLVVEGELRVRMKMQGSETVLTTLGPGDFFGDISIFDHGPRSADVIADSSSVLLKISSAAFGSMAKAAPELATPFLLAIGKTLTARIRAGNKHHAEAVKFANVLESPRAEV